MRKQAKVIFGIKHFNLYKCVPKTGLTPKTKTEVSPQTPTGAPKM